jgi:hypothetical protein
MTFIEHALPDVEAFPPVPDGKYRLRISDAQEQKSRKGDDMIVVSFAIEGAPKGCSFKVRHWFGLPGKDTSAERRQMQLLDLKRFLTAFHLPVQGGEIDLSEWIGSDGSALLTQEVHEETGQVFNRIRFPRLDAR